MLTVQDDWIQYEAVPARRIAVRGGSSCAQRIPVVRAPAPVRPVLAPVRSPQHGRPEARRRPRRRRLRLTRRGRVVLVVVPGLLAVSGVLAVLSGTGAAAAATAPPAVTAAAARASAPATTAAGVLVVRRGDSLWAIAQRVAPGADPAAVVAALQRRNGLHGTTIRPGDVLRLPAGR